MQNYEMRYYAQKKKFSYQISLLPSLTFDVKINQRFLKRVLISQSKFTSQCRAPELTP